MSDTKNKTKTGQSAHEHEAVRKDHSLEGRRTERPTTVDTELWINVRNKKI